MCLLVMLSRVVDGAPLVVAANRDERLERPADAIGVLRGCSPRILGGRDELAGGTWLAVNEHGLVAALTNRPAPGGRDPAKRSRGELPLALAQHSSASEAVEDFVGRFDPADYNRAWLLVADRTSLYSIDMSGDGTPVAAELAPGIHILENLPLGSSSPKVDHVGGLLERAGVAQIAGEELLEELGRILSDHTVPAPATRAARDPEPERRPETLAACVHSDGYGTRSSTLVLVPAGRSPIEVRVADGHPCERAFTDATSLWG